MIYIVAGAEIFKKHRALRDFSSSDNHHSSGRRSAGPVESFKTTEVHVSTELADLASPGKPEHSSTLSPRDATMPRTYSQYNVTIGRGDDVEAGTAAKNLSRPQKRALTERNTAAWAYTKAAVLFFIALLITWVRHLVNVTSMSLNIHSYHPLSTASTPSFTQKPPTGLLTLLQLSFFHLWVSGIPSSTSLHHGPP